MITFGFYFQFSCFSCFWVFSKRGANKVQNKGAKGGAKGATCGAPKEQRDMCNCFAKNHIMHVAVSLIIFVIVCFCNFDFRSTTSSVQN